MRSKSRTVQVQQPLRRSPRKSASTHLPVPVSQSQVDDDEEGGEKSDNPSETVFEKPGGSGGGEKGIHLVPQMDNMDLDSLGLGTCIRCSVRDDSVLACLERGCLIAVHEKCMGCDAMFDDSGRFRCPFCHQKLALARVKETRRKVMEAKKALSRFLEGNVAVNRETGRSNDAEEVNRLTGLDRDQDQKEGMENEESGRRSGDDAGPSGEGTSVCVEGMARLPEIDRFEAVEEEKEELVSNNNEDTEEEGEEERGPETSDGIEKDSSESETETLVKPSKRFKRRAGKIENHRRTTPQKDPVMRRKAVAKKNASTLPQKASTRSKFQAANVISIANFPEEKRKRLQWTEEEEEMLREGVQEYSEGKSNLPWRKILEYGRAVFHDTRVPGDLKDKWRHMTGKDALRPKVRRACLMHRSQ